MFFANTILYAQTPKENPSPRYGHSLVEINDILYLFGGITANNIVLNDLWTYSECLGKWELKNPCNKPPPRQAHSVVVYQYKMYIFYGEGQNGILEDIWQYNPVADTWEQFASLGIQPVPRKYHTTVPISEGLLVFGGLDHNGIPLDDIWLYDPPTRIWQEKKKCSGGDHFGHSAEIINDKMFVIGGRTETLANGVWYFSIPLNNWENVIPLGYTSYVFRHHSTASYNNIIWFHGGINNFQNILSSCYVFDIINNTWIQMEDGPAVFQSAAAYSNGYVYLFGGITEYKEPTDDFWKYDITTGTWDEITVIKKINILSNVFVSVNPNPFKLTTTFIYNIPYPGKLTLKIFNLYGKEIKTFINFRQSKGKYEIHWDASNFPADIYIYQFIINNKIIETQKLILVK